MACFHPIAAWQHSTGGKLTFKEGPDTRALWIPCGKCIGCRHVKARSWAIRCLHEAQLHKVNSFITLTYSDEHYHPSLKPKDFQLFMRRLRKQEGPTRFYACGEYGDETFRPHYHALLFGRTFDNAGPVTENTYRSHTLEKLWPYGHSSFGNVTLESAAYVARYALKKITGEKAQAWYSRIDHTTGELVQCTPEFSRMSLKPGIGKRWFEKYWREVYLGRDAIVRPGGKEIPPPKAYDRWLAEIDPLLKEEKDYDRFLNAQNFVQDNTHERLKVREKCAAAKAAFLKRHL